MTPPNPGPYFQQGRRQHLLTDIRRAMKGTRDVVVISGPKGAGKTTLARLLARDLMPATLALRLDGGQLQTAGSVLRRVGGHLGLDVAKQKGNELTSAVSERMKHSTRPLVLILDNAHRLPTAAMQGLYWLLRQRFKPIKAEVKLILLVPPGAAPRFPKPLQREIEATIKIPRLRLRESLAYLECHLRPVHDRYDRLLPQPAIGLLAVLSLGVPGQINRLVEKTLSAAAKRDRKRAEVLEVLMAWWQNLGATKNKRLGLANLLLDWRVGATLGLLVGGLVLIPWAYNRKLPAPTPAVATATSTTSTATPPSATDNKPPDHPTPHDDHAPAGALEARVTAEPPSPALTRLLESQDVHSSMDYSAIKRESARPSAKCQRLFGGSQRQHLTLRLKRFTSAQPLEAEQWLLNAQRKLAQHPELTPSLVCRLPDGNLAVIAGNFADPAEAAAAEQRLQADFPAISAIWVTALIR